MQKSRTQVLFTHVVTSLGFNDPYVPERMLAAAYGATLSLVDSEATPTFRPLLVGLAKALYRKMFGLRASNATHHTLMRDYGSASSRSPSARVVSRYPIPLAGILLLRFRTRSRHLRVTARLIQL